MQMSAFLALVQAFLAAASSGVAILALERVAHRQAVGIVEKARARHPSQPGRLCGAPSGQSLLGDAYCSTLSLVNARLLLLLPYAPNSKPDVPISRTAGPLSES